MNVGVYSFEIMKFNEIKKDEISGDGVMKHWHIYTVLAQNKH